MHQQTVAPISVVNTSLTMFFPPFSSGPEFQIVCGKCQSPFVTTLPYQNFPALVCPSCSANNVIPVMLNTYVIRAR